MTYHEPQPFARQVISIFRRFHSWPKWWTLYRLHFHMKYFCFDTKKSIAFVIMLQTITWTKSDEIQGCICASPGFIVGTTLQSLWCPRYMYYVYPYRCDEVCSSSVRALCIMSAMASQTASVCIICSSAGSGADQRKDQRSASLAFVRIIHRWIPRTKRQQHGKFFHLMKSSCGDVIMRYAKLIISAPADVLALEGGVRLSVGSLHCRLQIYTM